MKRTTLAHLIAAWGSDSDDDDDDNVRIEAPKPKAKPRRRTVAVEDDDDDDDYIDDPKDRRIRKLSRESGRRRVENADLQADIEAKNEEIEELKLQVANGLKLQKKYDKLQEDMKTTETKAKEQAIRTAISGDTDDKGKKRTWYDTSMVLSLLDRDSLAVDLSDGSIGGLSDQLAAIAKDKPFLLKAVSDDQGNNGGQQQQPSGSAPQTSATGTRGQGTAESEKTLVDMFPALRNVTK